MEYRLANKEDIELVRQKCEQNKIDVPSEGIIVVAVNDLGQLVGCAGLKLKYFIEPLISDNGVVANNLFRMIDGHCLITGASSLRCIADESMEDVYTKAGFETIETGKIIMERKY